MALIYSNKKRVPKLQQGGYSTVTGNSSMSSPGASPARYSKSPLDVTSADKYFDTEPIIPTYGKADTDDTLDTRKEPDHMLYYEDSKKDLAEGTNLQSLFTTLRGDDPEDFTKFIDVLGTVSYTETGRKNIRASINTKTGRPSSSAKGYFQMTDDSFDTNKQRMLNVIKKYNLDPDRFEKILKAKDVRELSAEDQSILALVHMHYSPKIPLTSYLKRDIPMEELYRGWVGDTSNKVYKNDEHIKNLRKKMSEIKEGKYNNYKEVTDFIYNSKDEHEGIDFDEVDKKDDAAWALNIAEKTIKANSGVKLIMSKGKGGGCGCGCSGGRIKSKMKFTRGGNTLNAGAKEGKKEIKTVKKTVKNINKARLKLVGAAPIKRKKL